MGDNKLLTLPNGERLNLPPNVRIMFEVEHLHYATLATVSRCGMIWFGEDVIEPSMVYATTSTLFRQCLWMRMMEMLLTFLAVVPMCLLLTRLTLLTSRLKYRSRRF
jgi:hypothetical protein